MNILNLCVIASTKTDKYKKRLYDFIHYYGYKNLYYKDTVKINFLVEDDIKPDFVTPEFGWFNYPNLPLSLRFISYLKFNYIPSTWTMQVDDDSSTDIDKTIELLNQFYDHDDSMILMGGRNTDMEIALQNIVKDMNEKNILFNSCNINNFDDNIPYFVHAWEPSILSSKAVNKIQNYEKFSQFYDLNLKHNPVFSDQSIYLLSKLAKVPIVEVPFLCPYDRPNDFSAINPLGKYSHLHYIKEESPCYQKICQILHSYKSYV